MGWRNLTLNTDTFPSTLVNSASGSRGPTPPSLPPAPHFRESEARREKEGGGRQRPKRKFWGEECGALFSPHPTHCPVLSGEWMGQGGGKGQKSDGEAEGSGPPRET